MCSLLQQLQNKNSLSMLPLMYTYELLDVLFNVSSNLTPNSWSQILFPFVTHLLDLDLASQQNLCIYHLTQISLIILIFIILFTSGTPYPQLISPLYCNYQESPQKNSLGTFSC